MKILVVVMLALLNTFSVLAEKNTKQLNTLQNEDYLAELKEKLVLKWPNNRTINVVFHGHSVPSGYFRGGHVNTLAAYPHLFL